MNKSNELNECKKDISAMLEACNNMTAACKEARSNLEALKCKSDK